MHSQAFPAYHVTGQDLWEDTWLHGVILKDLTRSISAMIPDLLDELEVAAQQFLPSDEDGKLVSYALLSARL